MAEKDADIGTANQALLKKIRTRYAYGMDKWRRNREEGQKNMRYVAGDPWSEEDKQARKGRPTVCPDELNQYVNQVVNTARQNPRGVKVDPAGGTATEKLAEYRENRIRAIEYGCNAPQVYVNGLQAAVERNIGYWRVTRAYVSDDSDEQEIIILPVQNPDSVIIDPDYKEMDGSDIKWAFELDKMPIEDFEAEYPKAEKRSFSAEDFGGDALYWYDGESILTASYWEVTTDATSKRGKRSVRQYITNGVEILKKGAIQPGPYIPIVPVFGKEIWVDYSGGGNAERVLLSLVSLARDAQKALAFVMSSMLENCGQIPKASFIGAVGQFETDMEAWQSLNSVYHPFLQYDVKDASDGTPLPAPQRTPLTPDFQAYSVGTDICRRAIQAAMGTAPLPSAAQRANQKSGKALEKIQSEQAIGSYHLPDAMDRAIKLTGRIINHWLAEVDLGETKRPVRLADGKHKLVQINTDAAVMEDGHEYHFPIADDKGLYQVTISAGPSHDSQREEGSEFVDSLMQNLQNLPQPGTPAAQILAMGIRMKQLGPLGDQLADLLSGQGQNMQMQQQMSQMQQQGALMKEEMGKMQALIQKLMLERQGKVIEGQFKMAEADKDRETKIAVAEIQTKAQSESERQQAYTDMMSQFHDQAHDVAMQADQQGHEQGMAAQQHAQALQQGQQSAMNQSAQSAQDAAQAQQSATPAQGE